MLPRPMDNCCFRYWFIPIVAGSKFVEACTVFKYECCPRPLFFFSKSQIILMAQLLSVPETIRTDCGYAISGRTAFCVLLYRMAFPCRFKDMRMIFHLPDSLLCEAFNYMLHFMNDTFGHVLTLDIGRLVSQIETFAQALQNWGDVHCPTAGRS